jgi:hypothetical protein
MQAYCRPCNLNVSLLTIISQQHEQAMTSMQGSKHGHAAPTCALLAVGVLPGLSGSSSIRGSASWAGEAMPCSQEMLRAVLGRPVMTGGGGGGGGAGTVASGAGGGVCFSGRDPALSSPPPAVAKLQSAKHQRRRSDEASMNQNLPVIRRVKTPW